MALFVGFLEIVIAAQQVGFVYLLAVLHNSTVHVVQDRREADAVAVQTRVDLVEARFRRSAVEGLLGKNANTVSIFFEIG